MLGYGTGAGIGYLVPIHHGWLWFPKSPGTASGIGLAGFGVAQLIFNNVAVALVNPDGVSKNRETGYYPSDVYEKVPFMLRVLAIIYTGLIFLAICLVWSGPQK